MTLIIDPYKLVCGIQRGLILTKDLLELYRSYAGLLCGDQHYKKTSLGYYANYDLKRYGKLSNAVSLLRNIKLSGLQICLFYAIKKYYAKEILRGIYYIFQENKETKNKTEK